MGILYINLNYSKIQLEFLNIFLHTNIKLILRSLSDMTEDEAVECGWKKVMSFKEFKEIKGCRPVNQVIALIKMGFDLFGLIESGQAIKNNK